VAVRSPSVLYTLSLHDALPICVVDDVHIQRVQERDSRAIPAGYVVADDVVGDAHRVPPAGVRGEGQYICADLPHGPQQVVRGERSEEHTSELQSLAYLVCRLLL